MSSEAIQLMAAMDRRAVENQIGLQCAPLLTGVKISNLLGVDRRQKAAVLFLLRSTGISCRLLCECGDRANFFLYRKEELEAYLGKPKVSALMRRFGYRPGLTLDAIFERVATRYAAHMQQKDPFPHEIGLLLGYPPEDVEGFIRYKGQHFLYSGYWKVYANLPERLAVFDGYDQAKETIVRLMSAGWNLHQILEQNAGALRQNQIAV